MKRRILGLIIGLFVLICGFISACNAGSVNGITPSPISSTSAQLPTPTMTTLPGRVALIAPMSLDAGYVTAFQAQVTDLVHSSGMILDVREGLEPGDIGEDWKIVIFLFTPPNLNDMLSVAPGVQFLVVNAVGLQPSQNLSLIQGRPERKAFIAGFVTSLVAPDWRSMALLPADEPYGTIIQEAFLNGASYLCGRCSPVYSPIVPFPQWAAMPSGTDAATWQGLVDQMLINIIYAAYVTPEAASPELLRYIAGKGLVLVGGRTPPEDVRPRWAATVEQDLLSPLDGLWPDLIAGSGGKTVDSQIKISDINPMYLTSGRQQLAENTVQELQEGWISPLTYSQQVQ